MASKNKKKHEYRTRLYLKNGKIVNRGFLDHNDCYSSLYKSYAEFHWEKCEIQNKQSGVWYTHSLYLSSDIDPLFCDQVKSQQPRSVKKKSLPSCVNIGLVQLEKERMDELDDKEGADEEPV